MPWGAETAVGKGESASCVVVLDNVQSKELWYISPAVTSVLASHLGAMVSVQLQTFNPIDLCPPPGDPDDWSPVPAFVGGIEAVITVQAPGGPPPPSDTIVVAIYARVGWVPIGGGATTYVEYDAQPYSIDCSFTVSNVGLRCQHSTVLLRSDGGVTHPTECSLEDRWFADDSSQVTVSAAGLSVSGSLGYAGGDEIDLGSNPWQLSMAATVHGSDSPGARYVGFENIHFAGQAVSCSACNQVSNTTWQAGRGWDHNDGGQWEAVGAGANINIKSRLENVVDHYTWSGWVKQPRMVSFADLVVCSFTEGKAYPEAVLRTGFTDIEGNELVASVAELVAMGVIVQPDVYSWIAQTAYEVPPYVWWSGWKPPTTLSLTIDQEWALANNEWRTDGTYNDGYIILDGWPLTATDRSSDPEFAGPFTMAHVASVAVNDPPTTSVRGTPGRPSAWAGSGGASVAPGDNDAWTVASGASAPEVTRELVSIWFDRQDAVKAGSGGSYEHGVLPDTFLYAEANMDPNYPAPADDVTREDVTNWDNHAYLLVEMDSPVTCELVLTVDWLEVTQITDSKLSDSTRASNYTYTTSARTADYSVALASGPNQVRVDLIGEPDSHEATKMRHVTQLTWSGFPTDAERTWTLSGLSLVRAATDSFRHAKSKLPWNYTELGMSGVVDGKIVLQISDEYASNIENGLPYVNWLIGAATGTDLSTAFTLEQIAHILDGQEGYTASFSQSGWDSYTKDADGNVLVGGLPWHLVPHTHRDEDVDGWTWPLAIRVRSYNIVAGIVYTVHATKRMHTAAHGVVFADDGSRQDETTVYVFRRSAGTSTGGWVLASYGVTNALGYWAAMGLEVLAENGDAPPDGDLLYQYAPSLTESTGLLSDFTTGHEREWMALAAEAMLLQDPKLCRDVTGVTWRVTERGGRLYVHWLGAGEEDTWEGENQAQPFGGSDGFARPTIQVRDDGRILVCATDTAAGSMECDISFDRGGSWEGSDMSALGDGLQYGGICEDNGWVFMCGWADDRIWVVGSSQEGLERDPLYLEDDGSEVFMVEVCDAVVGVGESPPRSDVRRLDDGALLVVVGPTTGGTDTYRSRLPEDGFTVVA